MRRFLFAGVLASLLAFPTAARADTLTFSGLGSGAVIQVSQGTGMISGWAGEINWLLNGSTLFTTYCADLYDDAVLPTQAGTLETTAALNSSTAVNALPNAGAMAAYLVNTYAAGAHGSNDAAAGLQIAIWEAMYGSVTYSATQAITDAANTFYNGLLAASPDAVLSSTAPYFDVTNDAGHIGSSANGQDQIGSQGPVSTPEPTSALLLAVGLFGLLCLSAVHWPRQRPRLLPRRNSAPRMTCRQKSLPVAPPREERLAVGPVNEASLAGWRGKKR